MTFEGHSHPVDAPAVELAQASGIGARDAERLGELLGRLSDPVRLRALFCFTEVAELCVGDLALALEISPDQSSYALRNLKAARLVDTRRDGRVIYYRLADDFPRPLLEHCLRQLLQLSEMSH